MFMEKKIPFDKRLSLHIDALHHALETATGWRRWWWRLRLRLAERRMPHV